MIGPESQTSPPLRRANPTPRPIRGKDIPTAESGSAVPAIRRGNRNARPVTVPVPRVGEFRGFESTPVVGIAAPARVGGFTGIHPDGGRIRPRNAPRTAFRSDRAFRFRFFTIRYRLRVRAPKGGPFPDVCFPRDAPRSRPAASATAYPPDGPLPADRLRRGSRTTPRTDCRVTRRSRKTPTTPVRKRPA